MVALFLQQGYLEYVVVCWWLPCAEGVERACGEMSVSGTPMTAMSAATCGALESPTEVPKDI